MHQAQKAYKIISAYANSQLDELNDEEYEETIHKVCQELFKSQQFQLKCEEITQIGFDDDSFNFKWTFTDGQTVLHLSKNTEKTHQYKLYFSQLSEEESQEYEDVIGILKILVNMVSWIKTLKCKV